MPALLALIPIRYWICGAAALAVVMGLVAVRAHYIHAGRDAALAAVRVQNATAKAAADRVQTTVDQCYARNGLWSTVTGSCTLEAKP